MASEPDIDIDIEEETVPAEEAYVPLQPVTGTEYYLSVIRYDIGTIAAFVDQLKFILELVLYALAGAMIGWCIGNLLF